MNTLELIKKTRPKIKIGDYFVFKIKNLFYVGLVIHNELIAKYGNNTMFTLLISDYNVNKIEDINVDLFIETLNKGNLLIPPINMNKKGWLNGFFLNVGRIEKNKIPRLLLNKCRFFYGLTTIYNYDYKEVNEIPDFKFIGRNGIYNDKGFEFLVQISLDLDFSDEKNDYSTYAYYDELVENYPNLELPFWYSKSKKRN